MLQCAKVLIGIPVYNEQRYVNDVLSKVLRFSADVLVIDDGSTDETPDAKKIRTSSSTHLQHQNPM